MDSSHIVQLSAGYAGTPVFFMPSAGTTFFSFVQLARTMQTGRPLYAFDSTAPMSSGKTALMIEDVSSIFHKEILEIQDSGPYYLIGHCWGGIVALDVAARLEAEGKNIGTLVLLESFPPKPRAIRPGRGAAGADAEQLDLEREIDLVIRTTFAQMERQLAHLPAQQSERLERQTREQIRMCSSYSVETIRGPVHLVRTPKHSDALFRDWKSWFRGRLFEHTVPGDTFSILSQPHVAVLAEQLDQIVGEEGKGSVG